MSSPKKAIYILGGIFLLGASTFMFSQGDWLKGTFHTMDYNPGAVTSTFNSVLRTTSAEEASTYAAQEETNAQTAAAAAAVEATNAETAWNTLNRGDLDSAHLMAENDADDATTASSNASDYADQAQAFYDADYAAWESSYNDTQDADEAQALAHTFWQAEYYVASKAHGEWFYGQANAYIQQVAYECAASAGGDSGYDSSSCTTGKSRNTSTSDDLKSTFDSCLTSDEYNQAVEKHSSTCVSDYSDALEAEWSDWNSKTIKDSIATTWDLDGLEADYNTKKELAADLESKYNEALTNYGTLFYTTADLRDIVDEDETYLTAAQSSATNARAYASQALSSKNLANSYVFWDCSNLSLSPDSYEMAAADTSADFELTASITTNETSTTSWSLKNLMTFVLSEVTEDVQVTGTTTAYPVETYETQGTWFGDLVFKSNGHGTFSDGTNSGNPLSISKTNTTDTTVSFSGGRVGDRIGVFIGDEQETCSAGFTVTQAGTPGVNITESAGSTALTEGGATDSYTVVLNAVPSANVTVAFTPDAQVTVSPSTLTFTSSNWDTAQTVTVTAVDDTTVETSQTGTITHTVTSTDSNYSGITVASVTATITDNDTTPSATTAGVTLTQSNGSTSVVEGGSTDSYTAVLNTAPSADVIITVTPNSQVTVSPSTLTFTSSNWNTAQTVTVTAVSDSTTESTQTGSITHSASSTDTSYSGISISSISVSVSDPATNTEALTDEDYSCSDPFVDTHGQWHQDIICRMYNGDVVIGRTSDEFVPNGNVTNAEFIKMVDGLLLEKTADDADGLTTDFTDVSEDDWYYPYIVIAEDADVIRTRDFGETFNPDTPITRGEATVYIARALGLTSYDYNSSYSDVSDDYYAAYAIAILSAEEVDVPYDDSDEEVAVVSGYSDGTFRPDNNIARSEAAAMIYRAYLAYLAN